MKFDVVAKNRDRRQDIQEKAIAKGFEYDPHNPDFILSVGGDGTFLFAERTRPGIPKLLVRDSLVCYKCSEMPLEKMLGAIQDGQTQIQELVKLEATCPKGQLLAVNDVVLRNKNPTVALRFQVKVDNGVVADGVRGDGVVVATQFGSTGYYRSVTRSDFDRGWAVGFNNPIEPREPLFLANDAQLKVTITRNCAQLAVDNHPLMFKVAESEVVSITQSKQVARLLVESAST